jgi:hypothetical protein
MARKPTGLPEKRNPLAKDKEEPPASYVDTLGTGRKRRKDATGRKKKDYHLGTQALAVRLPDELAERVRARAQSEGLSVNAWLARLIEREME